MHIFVSASNEKYSNLPDKPVLPLCNESLRHFVYVASLPKGVSYNQSANSLEYVTGRATGRDKWRVMWASLY